MLIYFLSCSDLVNMGMPSCELKRLIHPNSVMICNAVIWYVAFKDFIRIGKQYRVFFLLTKLTALVDKLLVHQCHCSSSL